MKHGGFVHMQVHEKSILLALLPVTLLALEEPVVAAWLPVWATVSMFPLLRRDGLSIAYAACLLLWSAVAPQIVSSAAEAPVATDILGKSSNAGDRDAVRTSTSGGQGVMQIKKSRQQFLHYLSLLCALPAVCIHAAQCVLSPPARFLHLYDAAFVTLCFVPITASAAYLNTRQWSRLQPAFLYDIYNAKSD